MALNVMCYVFDTQCILNYSVRDWKSRIFIVRAAPNGEFYCLAEY